MSIHNVNGETRGTCATCKHFMPDPEAGRSYFGEPNADSGWCDGWLDQSNDSLHMLCGDWCERFAAKEGGL